MSGPRDSDVCAYCQKRACKDLATDLCAQCLEEHHGEPIDAEIRLGGGLGSWMPGDENSVYYKQYSQTESCDG